MPATFTIKSLESDSERASWDFTPDTLRSFARSLEVLDGKEEAPGSVKLSRLLKNS